MVYTAPKLSDFVCITESVELGAIISNLFSKKNTYFPILEPPRTTRPDADNEATKINNAVARLKSKKIIFAALSEQQKELLYEHFPREMVIEINKNTDIEKIFKKRFQKFTGQLVINKDYAPHGLYLAVKERKKLLFHINSSKLNSNLSGLSQHLVISENLNDITSIIATNYAISIDADLLFTDAIPSIFIEDINNSFFKLYSSESRQSQSDLLEDLIRKIKGLLPQELLAKIQTKNYSSITFITSGIPFGTAFNEMPTTHLFIYPHLGIFLANAIAAEQNNNATIKVAALVDPGNFLESEVDLINNRLMEGNTIVRVLNKSEASVKNMRLLTAAYPFDLLYISSHADEAPGYRMTYEFVDSEGIARTLITEEAIGLAWDPRKQMFHTTVYCRFISLDGIDWTNTEAKNKHYIGKAIIDFRKLNETDEIFSKIKCKEEISHVRGAMAYKMSDHVYMPALQGLADENTPVIISNACSSWKEISKNFVFAGARVYIGPIIDVINYEAVDVMKLLFEKYFHLPICLALWKTQRELYNDQIRRPYIMAGVHFASLKFPVELQTDYLIKRLSEAYFQRRWKAEKDPREDVSSNSKDFAEFIDQEIKAFTYSIIK